MPMFICIFPCQFRGQVVRRGTTITCTEAELKLPDFERLHSAQSFTRLDCPPENQTLAAPATAEIARQSLVRHASELGCTVPSKATIADPARALAVEVAENEQRRDYTAAEVRALAERMRGTGFRATPGRPRKGTRALLPTLGAVVGKSKRQLLRILDQDAGTKKVTRGTVYDLNHLRRILDRLLSPDRLSQGARTPARNTALEIAHQLAQALPAAVAEAEALEAELKRSDERMQHEH